MITYKEYREKQRLHEEWRKEHPVLASLGDASDFLRFGLWRHISDGRRSVKWGFQRMFRGYDDPAVWGYPYDNAERTLKILKHFKKHKTGTPIFITPKDADPDALTAFDEPYLAANQKKWDTILDTMIAGFQAYIDADDVFIETEDGEYDAEASRAERERLNKIWEEGAQLYIKHYGCLWD